MLYDKKWVIAESRKEWVRLLLASGVFFFILIVDSVYFAPLETWEILITFITVTLIFQE